MGADLLPSVESSLPLLGRSWLGEYENDMMAVDRSADADEPGVTVNTEIRRATKWWLRVFA